DKLRMGQRGQVCGVRRITVQVALIEQTVWLAVQGPFYNQLSIRCDPRLEFQYRRIIGDAKGIDIGRCERARVTDHRRRPGVETLQEGVEAELGVRVHREVPEERSRQKIKCVSERAIMCEAKAADAAVARGWIEILLLIHVSQMRDFEVLEHL